MSDLNERLLQCQSIIDLVCREHRPLKMSIPVQGDDEDVILSNAIGDAMKVITTQQRDLASARARIKELDTALRTALSAYDAAIDGEKEGPLADEVVDRFWKLLDAALSAKGGSDGT